MLALIQGTVSEYAAADAINAVCMLAFPLLYWLGTNRKYNKLLKPYRLFFAAISVLMISLAIRRGVVVGERIGYISFQASVIWAWITAGISCVCLGLYLPFSHTIGLLEYADNLRRQAEAKFESIFISAPDPMVTIDAEGTIQAWNTSAERVFGWTCDEAIGQKFYVLMPERFREEYRLALQRYLNTGEARLIGKTLQLFGLHKDGFEIPVEFTISTYQQDDESFFTGIIRER